MSGLTTYKRFGPERSPLRHTGLGPLGDKPWGTHVCVFYETADDLLQVHAEYFSAGLAGGQFCLWALSAPVSQKMAMESLRKSISGFDHYLSARQIEIVPGYQWYLQGEQFEPHRIIAAWHRKLDRARRAPC